MNELVASLRSFSAQVWLQTAGRLLCQIGFGLISFYIPILFVNQVGLSAASVGFSLGLSAVTEVVAHFVGGTLADSAKFGRKMALSLSAGLGILVSGLLVISNTLLTLTIASLLLGFSLGFYWTASSAAVMDETKPEERHQAFAVLGVGEYLGIGIGVLGGGALLGFVKQAPQLLFVGSGFIFLGFLLLILLGMTATQPSNLEHQNHSQGILVALKDKLLIVFVLANVFYATYVALVTSTIPLYFTNFVAAMGETVDASIQNTVTLFTWCYVGVGVLLQLPIAHWFTGFRRVHVLMVSMLLWALGFFLLWVTGTFSAVQFTAGIAALCILSIASVMYKPFSVAIVSDLAPETLRGVYMAVSSQSWTIGYFVGPILGGWAMDQPPTLAYLFWLVVAASTLICITLLWIFEAMNSAIVAEPSEL